MDALPANRSWQPSCSHGTYQHEAITSRSRQLLMMGAWLPETCWATIRREIKNTKSDIYLVFLIHALTVCLLACITPIIQTTEGRMLINSVSLLISAEVICEKDEFNLNLLRKLRQPLPVAVRSGSRSLAGIADLNPAGGMDVSALLWWLVQRSPTECGVSWVWSWSLEHEALAHLRLLHHGKNV